MRPSEFDTIAAVATPPGKGGVALIRCSGADAIKVASACFRPKSGKTVEMLPPRTAIYGDIMYKGAAIDDGILTLFPAPASYTGETTAEICCHGGILVTRTVLEALLEAGARLATRGEFTRRAFLNDRLSLTEAEAVGDLLEAKTTSQMLLSSVASRHKLTNAIDRLHAEITHLLSSVYAVIDFPDEDLAELTDDQIKRQLADIRDGLQKLQDSYHTGHAISEGIPTVIVGKPNVGKSSLYNALSGEDAAIVTPIAGTTRDLLRTTVQAGQVTLHLTDTAGLHESCDEVEEIGIKRAEEALLSAELILAMFDISGKPTDEDRLLVDKLLHAQKTVIAIGNKSDLLNDASAPLTSDSDWTSLLEGLTPYRLSLSVRSDHIEDLTDMINALYTNEKLTAGADAILFDARQNAAVSRALSFVCHSLDAFTSGIPADVAFEDLELAVSALTELDGRGVSEEMVDHIFSRFCVGK